MCLNIYTSILGWVWHPCNGMDRLGDEDLAKKFVVALLALAKEDIYNIQDYVSNENLFPLFSDSEEFLNEWRHCKTLCAEILQLNSSESYVQLISQLIIHEDYDSFKQIVNELLAVLTKKKRWQYALISIITDIERLIRCYNEENVNEALNAMSDAKGKMNQLYRDLNPDNGKLFIRIAKFYFFRIWKWFV